MATSTPTSMQRRAPPQPGGSNSSVAWGAAGAAGWTTVLIPLAAFQSWCALLWLRWRRRVWYVRCVPCRWPTVLGARSGGLRGGL